jgi:hypothetical protein
VAVRARRRLGGWRACGGFAFRAPRSTHDLCGPLERAREGRYVCRRRRGGFIHRRGNHRCHCSIRWEARLDPSKFGSPTVIDAYEEGRGYLAVKVGGIPLKRESGLDADRGELQRYLSSIMLCPAILLNHPSLEWTTVGALTLRVRDRIDPTGATVDLVISEEGSPMMCRAERPRLVGKKAILTPWSGSGGGFREWQGMRMATRGEAAWHLPERLFTYYRAEIKSLRAQRGER